MSGVCGRLWREGQTPSSPPVLLTTLRWLCACYWLSLLGLGVLPAPSCGGARDGGQGRVREGTQHLSAGASAAKFLA